MDAALSPAVAFAAEPPAPWAESLIPPDLDLGPLTPKELRERLRGGEVEADVVEALLVWASRARGAFDLAVAEGLCALKQGERLAQLAYHLDDYAREVLDIGETTTRNLVKLGSGVRDRPLLRDAVWSGRIGTRAAEIVLPVARGDDEAAWVGRAAHATVRELEAAVRRAKAGLSVEEDEWFRIRTHLPELEQQTVDVALELAGQLMPGSTKLQRLEAIAQEFLGEFSSEQGAAAGAVGAPDVDAPPAGSLGETSDERASVDADDATRPLGPEFRRLDPGHDSRRAELEERTERWAHLPALRTRIPIPDVRFDDIMTAQEVDGQLRALAKQRRRWDDLVGWCAHALKRAGIHRVHGFRNFRHYVEERLGLSPRAVEQRVALEARLWSSPALREARRHAIGYEKLRVLSKLPERDIAAWIPRAKALTVIALRRRVDGERERQMRAARTFTAAMPRRVAALLAAAVDLVRSRARCPVPLSTCLAEVAWHFVDTWKHVLRVRRSRAQRIRARDGHCRVPGCSRVATATHHVVFRSHGGGHGPENQVGVCDFHHLRCIHGGWLTVVGQAPDALRWFVGGEPFDGTPRELAPPDRRRCA